MYVYPAYLPAVSNREDLVFTVGVYDDDTGNPLEMSGVALANPSDFTGSDWTVTDGDIQTTSDTELTIPYFPIGNELEAVALVVAENLQIVPGDPITIADPTGLNAMSGYVQSYAASTGALVVQVGCTFLLTIRPGSRHHDGYTPSWDVAYGEGHADIITACLGNGISIVGTGMLQVRIPASSLQRLRSRTYDVGMIMFDGSDTRELLLGKLPVIAGVVHGQPISNQANSNPYGLP